MKPFGRSWFNGFSVAAAAAIGGQAFHEGKYVWASIMFALVGYWLRAQSKAR